jgi:outer membrane beta-barrel protein
MSSDFQDTFGIQGTLGYYFNETWAIEGVYNKYNNSDNDAFTNLQRINQSIPFIRKPVSSYGVMGVWSPFYGKINTFNKIIYFDWSFGFGVGKINTKSNKDTVSDSTKANIFSDESYTTLMEKTSLKFHLTESLHLGLDYYFQSYKAPGPTINTTPSSDKWRHNSDIILSIGISF